MFINKKLIMVFVLLLTVTFGFTACSNTSSVTDDIDNNDTVSEFNVIVQEPGANLNESLNYFKLADTEVSLAGKTATTDENGVATFNNIKKGEQILKTNKEGYENFSQKIDVAENALPYKIDITQSDSALLEPDIREFNLNNPENINTTIEWNDASSVEGVYRILEDDEFEVTNLVDNNLVEFNETNSTLTINKDYILNYQDKDKLEIFIKFDQGTDALLVVDIVEKEVKENAEINPSEFDFNLNEPQNIETIITWNQASEVTSIESKVQENSYDIQENDYFELNEETSTLTISTEDILNNNPNAGDVLEYVISFDTGDPASLLVNITENEEEPEEPQDPEEPEDPVDGNITVNGNFEFEHNFPGSVVESSSMGSEDAEIWEANQNTLSSLSEKQENELIIKFRSNLSEKEAQEEAKSQGYKPLDYMPELNAMLVEIPDGSVASQEVTQLSNNPEILSAAKNNQLEIYDYTTPKDTHYDKQWGSPVMRLPQTWRDNTGSNRARIAVLDTGIDNRHADLKPNLNVGDGYNFADGNTNTMDNHGHGTHVAGIIGAIGDNQYGVAGVMWNAEIVPVKVLSDSGAGSEWSVAQGILYAAGLLDNNKIQSVDVINLSLGMDGNYAEPTLIKDAAQKAANAGVIMVAAAGNTGTNTVGYPAKFEETIAVGALTENSNGAPTIASYSSYGPEVEVVAPGSSIISTIGDASVSYKSGTSMAAPQVAGLSGLLIANGTPNSQVRAMLIETAIDLGSEGFDEKYGHGMVNAYWATNQATELNIMVGTRDGDNFNAVASTTASVSDDSFTLNNVPAGDYEVITWLDVRDNNQIENGDYLDSTGTVTLQNNSYNFDFNLKENY
ncbi:MAG: S8 family peptidase [Bacillota bacterium]